MLAYIISTGQLFVDGVQIGTGYAGKLGPWRNNPGAVREVAKGPLPCGLYRVLQPHNHARLGPLTMALHPVGHDALGRTGFAIHGDSSDGDASKGCIVMNRTVRARVADLWHQADCAGRRLYLRVEPDPRTPESQKMRPLAVASVLASSEDASSESEWGWVA